MKTAFRMIVTLSTVLLTACNACSEKSDSKPTDTSASSQSAVDAESSTNPANPANSGVPTGTAATPQEFPPVALASGLQFTDVRIGAGAEAVDGKQLTVHYTGTLIDGTKFDSSRDRNQPFTFMLGNGDVIAGWEQGFKGMREGGARKLVIPPSLGYANEARGVIPSNSTLLFEVELLKVE